MGVNAESLISLKEAAARSGLSPSHLRLLARTGRLRATRLGRDWFTTAADVTAYLEDPALRSKNPHKHPGTGNDNR
jgi:excisionase family DNA binding protein